jgi:hypothetical protein
MLLLAQESAISQRQTIAGPIPDLRSEVQQGFASLLAKCCSNSCSSSLSVLLILQWVLFTDF